MYRIRGREIEIVGTDRYSDIAISFPIRAKYPLGGNRGKEKKISAFDKLHNIS